MPRKPLMTLMSAIKIQIAALDEALKVPNAQVSPLQREQNLWVDLFDNLDVFGSRMGWWKLGKDDGGKSLLRFVEPK